MFFRVEQLRDRLVKDFPNLIDTSEIARKNKLKPISVESHVVRPSITSNEIANMLHRSSKHKKVKDLDYGPLPKKLPGFKLKVHEYEIENSLDCFMKHIATKSFEKYVTEKTPIFRKSAVTEVHLPECDRRKRKKISYRNYMNLSNLEIFGQVEVKSQSPKLHEKNLKTVERNMQKNVKSWCLQEKKKIIPNYHLIDRFTFKRRH